MEPSEPDLNHTFPDKVCINLERRSDRWRRMLARFAQHGITNVTRFEAVDGSSVSIPPSWDDFPGSYGCLQSHLRVIENAQRKRNSSVLIIEDDVEFHPEFRHLFSQSIKQLPDDWDMLYFGALHGEPLTPVAEHIARMTHSLSTYMYALKHTIFEAFIDLNRQALTVLDENTRALQKHFNCYCFMPHLAWVEEDHSDVRGERSSLWWLRESLVLFGDHVEELQSKTLAVIFHRGRGEAALNNLGFVVDYFSRLLPAIKLVVVDQENDPAVNKAALPANCHLLLTSGSRGRSFNRAVDLYASQKEFFIFLDSDIVLTREDIRGNLLRCRDHDFTTACGEIWDLNESDTARVLSNDLRWNYNGLYHPRAKANLCQAACFVTRNGLQLAGGWDEDGGAILSERVQGSLRVYRSPNAARRLSS